MIPPFPYPPPGTPIPTVVALESLHAFALDPWSVVIGIGIGIALTIGVAALLLFIRVREILNAQ
ncbi:MAG: hypothetical protein HY868_25610 [Chloroflexi bacterium]|nr:hypothetical protein [Chloroflexota bacterium]